MPKLAVKIHYFSNCDQFIPETNINLTRQIDGKPKPKHLSQTLSKYPDHSIRDFKSRVSLTKITCKEVIWPLGSGMFEKVVREHVHTLITAD